MKNLRQLLQTATAIVLACASLAAGAADLKEIRERGVIRHLGIKYANFVTADGRGFDVEIMQGFARHIGVKYELVYSDFYNVIRDLLGKDVARKGDEVTLVGDYPVRGDVIATGTPPGDGMGKKPNPIWLKAGDVMTLGSAGLGEQKQNVRAD